jgi:hypothetical protein
VARGWAEIGRVQRAQKGVVLDPYIKTLDERGKERLTADALVERIAFRFEMDRAGQPGRPARGGSLVRSSISGLWS